MREHWRRSLKAPDEELYGARERAAFEVGNLNLLKLGLRGPLSSHVCDIGNMLMCKEAQDASTFHSNGSKAYNPHIGIVGDFLDWRIAFGQGWELLNAKFQMSTAATAMNSLLTYTDTSNTDEADMYLTRLLTALKRTFGDNHIAGGRGMYLYPPGGFHEWHTNQAHTEGWRMYLVKVDEPGASWTAFKDPRTGRVHRRPDRSGKINMFRVSPSKLLWHTIYSTTNRWSYGTVLSDHAASQIIAQLKKPHEQSLSSN